MKAGKLILVFCASILLISCSTTPKLHVRSAGITMEIDRPASYVFSAAFTPDGKYALSGSLDTGVAVWDIAAGSRIAVIDPQFTRSIGVHTLAFSPDGKRLLMGARGGGEVGLWDAAAWKPLRKLQGHTITECVEDFAFSEDGKYIWTGGSYSIKRWDADSGKEIGEITHAAFFDRNQSLAMAFSPDRRFAFTRGIGFFSLLDINSGKRLWIYGDKTGGTRWSGGAAVYANSVKFSPAGEYVLSGEDTILKLRDARTGCLLRTFVDEGTGQIDAVAFSPDGKYAAAGSQDGKIRLWDVQSGAKIRTLAGHSDEVSGLAFSPDGKKIISSADASARLWDASTGEELAAMMALNDKEWLVITPEGYYNSSENGAEFLSVAAGDARYGVDRFYDVFYRPDIVAAKLRGEDIRDLVTIRMSDAIKSPPPVVEIASLNEKGDTGRAKARVCYRVKGAGGGIGEIRLFHNGKLVESDGYYRESSGAAGKTDLAALDSKAIYRNMRSIAIKGKTQNAPALISRSKGDEFEECREIDAAPGENEISVAAFNASNTVQSSLKTAGFRSKAEFPEPALFILAIGIDRYGDAGINLKYAAKDAADVLEKLKTRAATLYRPGNIQGVLLTDREAGKTNILKKIDELAAKIKPQDSFILFAAAHGILLQNQYYLLTSDYSGSLDNANMISSNEIVEASKRIKSLVQLMIFDTCHAGGVDHIVSGLYDARMSALAKRMGLHIFASAGDKQTAMDGYRGNGLFTYALLDGLDNRGVGDGEGKITIAALGEYAKRMTINISREIGHTQTPLIINFGKDSPLLQLK